MQKLLLIQTMLPILLAGADLTIDHVTVAGARLKDMQSALTALGIAADNRGAHGNRATEMAIVSFPDGSYLELIALQADADPSCWQMSAGGNPYGERYYAAFHTCWPRNRLQEFQSSRSPKQTASALLAR